MYALRCGKFSLNSKARRFPSGGLLGDDPVERAVLSHAIVQMHEQTEWPVLSWDLIQQILKERTLPTPAEQADNLITWLGTKLIAAGESHRCHVEELEGVIGALSEAGVRFIAETLLNAGLIRLSGSADDLYHIRETDNWSLTLTFEGWTKLQELKKGNYKSKKAFMAMKFGDAELDSFFTNHLRAATAAAGFELRRLDDTAAAGLIDDRLRVEIRTSCFLIADLTHHNSGAYWEAGYAEGLGKPVIYTCRKDVFETEGSHFDTNHHLTVIWDPSDLSDAAKRLTATIRATLPAEAKLEDA